MSFCNRIGLLCLAILPCLLGCEDEVAWLSDSSGIVYHDGKKGWRTYDIRSKEQREIVERINRVRLESLAIATNARGDQFAIGEVERVGGNWQLKISIYALTGDLVHESEPILLRGAGYFDAELISLEWSAGGPLVIYQENAYLFGIYDPRTARMTKVAGCRQPFESVDYSTSLLPDGTGVLVLQMNKPWTKESRKKFYPGDLQILDWEGKTHPIQMPEIPRELDEVLNQGPEVKIEYAAWHKQTLHWQVQDFCLEVDSATKTAKWSPRAQDYAGQVPLPQDKKKKSTHECSARPLGDDGLVAYLWHGDAATIGIIDPRTKEQRVVVSDFEVDNVIPSPDGKRLCIVGRDAGMKPEQSVVLLLDEKGELRARLVRKSILD